MNKHSHSHSHSHDHDKDSATNGLTKAAADTAEAAQNRLAPGFEKARQLAINVRDKTVASAKATDKTVHEHPYKSLAVAAGIGFLLGFMLGHRPKKSSAQD